ncbi:MAG: DUF4342 domain-containing protein [bacterium]|nr:DUF4342 domain-containing protein [bacterium]
MEKEYKEEWKVSGKDLLAKVRELINEGKVRRIIIKNEKGNTLIEVPLHVGAVVGAVGVIFAPVLAAVGAIAALVTECTVVVVKEEKE